MTAASITPISSFRPALFCHCPHRQHCKHNEDYECNINRVAGCLCERATIIEEVISSNTYHIQYAPLLRSVDDILTFLPYPISCDVWMDDMIYNADDVWKSGAGVGGI